MLIQQILYWNNFSSMIKVREKIFTKNYVDALGIVEEQGEDLFLLRHT